MISLQINNTKILSAKSSLSIFSLAELLQTRITATLCELGHVYVSLENCEIVENEILTCCVGFSDTKGKSSFSKTNQALKDLVEKIKGKVIRHTNGIAHKYTEIQIPDNLFTPLVKIKS